MTSIQQFWAQQKKRRPAILWGSAAVLAGCFFVMLLFNILTPLMSCDDFQYRLIYPTHQPVTSLADVFTSQYQHYLHHNGRAVAHTLLQTFLLLGKGVFNLFNAAAFCTLVWATAKLALGRQAVRPLYLLLSLGLLVHFNPAFGMTNLWLSGSFNYLWVILWGALLLLPYRLELDAPWTTGRLAPVGMFLLGVVSGWGNENLSGAVFLGTLCFLVLHKIYLHTIRPWAVAGSLGSFVGLMLLVLAPGLRARGSEFQDSRGFLTILLTRIIHATHALALYGGVLLVVFGALFGALCLVKARPMDRALCLVYLLLALAANYAMVLSPVYYMRSFYPVLFFLAAADLYCLYLLMQASTALKPLQGLAAGALCGLLFFDLLFGGYDILNYSTMRRTRDNEIRAAVAAGESDVQTYAVYPYTRFCGAWGISDLHRDPDHWMNATTAVYYGANSLRATEQKYYPFPGMDDFSNRIENEVILELE